MQGLPGVVLALFVGMLVGTGAFTVSIVVTASMDAAPPSPTVVLADVDVTGPVVSVRVIRADLPRALDYFRAGLQTPEGTYVLDRLSPELADRLRFVDADRDRRLSEGDVFRAETYPRGSYLLRIFWRERIIAQADWFVPAIQWEVRGWGPVEYEAEVTAADPPAPLSDFVARVFHDSTIEAVLSPLRNGSSPENLLTFYDEDGDGRLSVGDLFVVRPTESGAWSLRLEWRTIPNWSLAWTR